MDTQEIKQKLLAEFQDWFCEPYCMYYGNEDYCKGCPIKDKDCWLKDLKEDVKEVNMTEKLRGYFQNTPKEQLDKDWGEVEHLNKDGVDVLEYAGVHRSGLFEKDVRPIIRIEVYREDYTASVMLCKHKEEDSYSFVNLTKGHICPCKFKSVDEAFSELAQQKLEGKILDYETRVSYS